ncbi:MAG: DUF2905 domain-containing protein [Candidatus Dadabacteria bacterium]|nr:MAG: DUF2905 domain-containing protein [Candidatus Dadabacteria bacterium]
MSSWLIGTGVLLILVGLVWRLGLFDWFGRLPGDIRIEGEHSRVYVPIVSMLVVSGLLTLLLNLVAWWIGRNGG